jgi:hypothetical protein
VSGREREWSVGWRYLWLEIPTTGDAFNWRYLQLEIPTAGDTCSRVYRRP